MPDSDNKIGQPEQQMVCSVCEYPVGKPPRPVKHMADGRERVGAVRWQSVKTMLEAGAHEAVLRVVGGFSDQRDVQQFLCSAEVVLDPADQEELWFDYVADTGDGFDSTATVSYALAQTQLTIDGQELGRGRVLVHGGDAVYPVADAETYEERFMGPMRSVLDHTCDQHPLLLGIPGNHDWTDGLSAWSKIMTQKGWVGGWKTEQERSYFATRLSDRWWLLGIDAQLGDYMDEGQVEFFAKLAKKFEPGSQVVLCVPAPTWVHQHKRPEAHQVVDYLTRKALAGRAEVRLILTGDLHHYSHYEPVNGDEREPHLVTAGGGGAYLTATHWLPEDLDVPCTESQDAGKSDAAEYRLHERYPTVEDSRRIGRDFWKIPLLNGAFPLIPAAIYLAISFSMLGAPETGSDASIIIWSILRPGALIGLGLLLASCFVGMGGFRRSTVPTAVGHFALHLAALVTLTRVWRFATDSQNFSPATDRLLGCLAVGAGGVLVGSLLLALSMLVADRVHKQHTLLASGLRSTDYRNFLRMRITADEELTVFPIGIRKSLTDWSAVSPEDGSWLKPATEPSVHFIETPFSFRADPDAADDEEGASSGS